jgi:hypothetical protein
MRLRCTRHERAQCASCALVLVHQCVCLSVFKLKYIEAEFTRCEEVHALKPGGRAGTERGVEAVGCLFLSFANRGSEGT